MKSDLGEGGTWLLLREGRCAFDYNMGLDEALLNGAPELGLPVLRFYGWTVPAASFGYSQKYVEIEKLTMLRPLVRRPTGGGLVPHDADWTYSLVFPPTHEWYGVKAVESYRRVHEWLRGAFARMNISTTLSPKRQKEILGQCFLGAEKDDLLWHGRKIAGAAQRRSRNGLLIQGSVQPPPVTLSRANWETAMCSEAVERLAANGKRWKLERTCEASWKTFGPRSTDGRNSTKSDKLVELGDCLAGINQAGCAFPAFCHRARFFCNEQSRGGVKQDCIAFRTPVFAGEDSPNDLRIRLPVAAGPIRKRGRLNRKICWRQR